MLLGALLLALNTIVLREVSLPQLNEQVLQSDDTLYVVNFWATWCKPCVAELPYFENANKQFASQKVKVVLVSLDFLKDKEKVKNFIANKQIESQVFLFNEKNPNAWLGKIDSSWSGAIPATVFYKNKQKLLFHEGEFTQLELDSIIQTLNK
jgi:thiol-disulfide isomerase/thioredoxin